MLDDILSCLAFDPGMPTLLFRRLSALISFWSRGIFGGTRGAGLVVRCFWEATAPEEVSLLESEGGIDIIECLDGGAATGPGPWIECLFGPWGFSLVRLGRVGISGIVENRVSFLFAL